MNYIEFEKCKNKRIVIWGFGQVGKSFAYLSLRCLDVNIVGFCDSNYIEHKDYSGIPLIHKQELVDKQLADLIVIAVNSENARKTIADELIEHGLKYFCFGSYEFAQLCDSIEKSDDYTKQRYADIIDDEKYLRNIYKCKMGKELNLDNPKAFNEKLQWLKLYNRNPLYTQLVDKYEAKKYVASIIGERYIVPTLGVWDKFDDIDFDVLPDKFVLKCTHDSGSVVICKDKKTFDRDEAKHILEKAQGINFYWYYREWPYKDVKPRLIAEEYLEDNTKQDNNETELTDYKIMCFGGEPLLLFTCTERFSGSSLKVTWFDMNWNRLDFKRHYPTSSKQIACPQNFDKIKELSRKLSSNLPFVRVDFFENNAQLYVGELTLYPGAGYEEFEPEEWDYRIGNMIKLLKD